VLKPLPSNHLFCEELGAQCEQLFEASKTNQLTLYMFSVSAAVVVLRAFIATGRPLKVALYTLEEPPAANGAVSRSASVGSSANEAGRMPKIPHSFRRYLRYWIRFCLGRPALFRAWVHGQNLTRGSRFTGWSTKSSRSANSCAFCLSELSSAPAPRSRKKAIISVSHGSGWVI